MDDRAQSFRSRVTQLNLGRTGRRRFTPELRSEALSYFDSRRESGACVEAVSEELGVSKTVLEKWRRKQSGGPEKAKGFVRVEPRGGSEGLVFEAPSGHRVSGLTLTDAMQLIARFS